MFGLGMAKSDRTVLEMSPFEVCKRSLLTFSIFEYHWGICLMHAINAELHRSVFDFDHIRKIIVFSAAAFVLAWPIFFILVLIYEILAWILLPLLLIPFIVYLFTFFKILYQIPSSIREMEIAQGKSSLVQPWLAVFLYFINPLVILYLQPHVNNLRWESYEQT